ncbi:MAG: hypothetical protein IJ416_02745 [Ruminiclostridium sp.]|nr:hypothetical protein [Ruminiclostridium sp.]
MESEKQTNYGYLNFLALADYFGVSTDYLLGRTENPSVEEDIQIACKVTGLSEKSIVILKSEAPKFEMQAMLTGETMEIPVGEWIINSIYPEMRLDLNRILFYLNFNLLLAKDSPISVSEYVYGAVSKISDSG